MTATSYGSGTVACLAALEPDERQDPDPRLLNPNRQFRVDDAATEVRG
ncbi:MAG: hypothetical protein HY002_16650 [Candidatus Rokubacteria bacterium]|nr:hypothetical protein [Candidatus Rokubacteria bacterium]